MSCNLQSQLVCTWRNNSYVSHLPVTGQASDAACRCGVPFSSCSLVGSSWRWDPGVFCGDCWDPTLGYPGEGPEGGTRILPIGTANITAWSSLLGSEILGKGVGDTFPGVWALQEHKLVGRGLKKARRHLDGAGWGSAFEPALVTAKLGRSSGAAVIWERSMVGEADVAAYTSTDCGRHRLCRVTLVVEGLKIHVVSVYGDCRSQDATLAIVEMCMGFVEPGDLWVICGDFNVEASDMVRWLGGRGVFEVMRPGTATCFSSGGDPTELDYFLVSPALRQLVVGCRAYEGTSLATHLPVVLHVAVGGTLQPLTRWIRPKCPGQEMLGRICGPIEMVQDELVALLSGPEWGGTVGGPPISQDQMDAGWAAWMRQACAEVHAATGADMDKAGDPYRLEEFDPLERCRTRSKVATVAEMFRWCDRRLAEAVAAHRRGNWACWSDRRRLLQGASRRLLQRASRRCLKETASFGKGPGLQASLKAASRRLP